MLHFKLFAFNYKKKKKIIQNKFHDSRNVDCNFYAIPKCYTTLLSYYNQIHFCNIIYYINITLVHFIFNQFFKLSYYYTLSIFYEHYLINQVINVIFVLMCINTYCIILFQVTPNELSKLIRHFIKHLHLYSNRAKHLPADNLKL